jgi:hypothetical protein
MSLKTLTDNHFFDYLTTLTVFAQQKISFLTRVIQESRYVVHIIGKFRRWYLVQFRKEYVLRQILVREGTCRQCGTCCNLLFTCPMLTKRRRCFIYGTCRPAVCKVFPIDQRDIHEIELYGGACGYRFRPVPTQERQNVADV